MNKSELAEALKGTYIKNDYGNLRALFVLLCLKAGLHEDYLRLISMKLHKKY